jgi:hypothetical protein
VAWVRSFAPAFFTRSRSEDERSLLKCDSAILTSSARSDLRKAAKESEDILDFEWGLLRG